MYGPKGELHRILTSSEEWGILALWHQGSDTYEISLRLGVHESEIANRLMRLRNGASDVQTTQATQDGGHSAHHSGDQVR